MVAGRLTSTRSKPRSHGLLALLALAMLCTGCRGKARRQAASADPEMQGILSKLHGYVACLDHAPLVFQLADVYTARFATTPPTPGTELPVLPATDPEQCVEAIADAKQVQPALPELDAAADAYGKAIVAVFAVTTSGHDYFDRTSKRYDPAKGAALHGQLMAAFQQFDAAQGALFDQVLLLNQRIRRDQLAAREMRDGRTFPVIVEDLMLRAEELVQFAARSVDHLEQVDHAALTTRLGRLETAIEEMSSVAVANAAEVNARMKGLVPFTHRARAYVIAVRQLASRVRDNVPFTESEKIMITANNERAVVGTPAAMIDAYNELVSAYTPL